MNEENKEARGIIVDLLAACDSQLDDMFQKKQADWGMVNKAMTAAEKYLAVNPA